MSDSYVHGNFVPSELHYTLIGKLEAERDAIAELFDAAGQDNNILHGRIKVLEDSLRWAIDNVSDEYASLAEYEQNLESARKALQGKKDAVVNDQECPYCGSSHDTSILCNQFTLR